MLVWLGTLSDNERRALHELDFISDEVEWRNWSDLDYSALGEKLSESGRTGIRSLIKSPYWERKWIIQEVELSPGTASVVVGGSTIPIHRIRGCFVTARMLMASDWNYRSDARRLNLLLPSLYSSFSESTFHAVVTKFKDSHCSEPRDHVYALLGLSSTTDFKVDYDEPLEYLYWRALKSLL